MASTSYELTGTVARLIEPRTFPSGFTKREFIVKTEDEYPQLIKLECVKDKCALLDAVKEGARVSVRFGIRGSEYQGKFFVNLQAWKITPADGAGAPAPAAVEHEDSEEFDDGAAPF